MTEQVDARTGRRIEGVAVALSFGAVVLFMAYLGFGSWLSAPASSHGGEIDHMLYFLLITTGGMAITGHLVLAFFIWRFTGQPKVSMRLASPRAERTWSIVIGLVMTLVAEGGVLAIGLPKNFADDRGALSQIARIDGTRSAGPSQPAPPQ